MKVRAVLVDDTDPADTPAGAFEYFTDGKRDIAGMVYVCPCGCGARGALNFRPHPSPSWNWNGNREMPTLTPSVHHQITRTGGEKTTHWHGWLADGEWRPC